MQAIDTFFLNKVAGWVLFTGLLVFGLNEIAHIIYHPKKPAQPGMVVEVIDDTQAVQDASHEEAPAVPIAELLAAADVERGQSVFRACQACHTVDKGGPNRVGPNLWGVVGHEIAMHEGYAYSNALKAKSGEHWTFENLDAFLRSPRTYAPGTKMTYAGLGRDAQRADLLAYLNSLSDDPQPLPAADAQPAAEEAPPPAENQSEAPAQQ